MKYGNHNHPWKKLMNSPIMIVILIGILALFAKASWNSYRRSATSADKLEQAQASLAGLKSRENTLTEQIKYLSTDEGIEAELRSKFRAAMEGESVAVIIGTQASATDGKAVGDDRPPSWWRRLLQSIGL